MPRPWVIGRVVRARWLSTLSVVCILGWAVPAVLMLRRGFAIEDEGSYVLAYRFWSSNPYFISGSQYFYGPVFEAFGESIAALRAVRLLMVLAANTWFAHCFLTWLRAQRPTDPADRPIGLVPVMVAAGGMSYVWTPLTPGYYDLTADIAFALVSLMLLALVPTSRGRAVVPVATGMLGVALVLTRWTAFPVALLVVAVACACLLRRSPRAGWLYLARVVLGGFIALTLCQLFLVPLPRFVSILARVSRLTAVGNHGIAFLLRDNVETTLLLLRGACICALPLLLGLAAARWLSRRGRDLEARWWLVSTAALTVMFPFALGWHGGRPERTIPFDVALAGLVAALVAVVAPPRRTLPGGGQGRLVAGVLLVVPLLQAAGTNVPPLIVAVLCAAMWVALALMPISDPGCQRLTVHAVLLDLGVLVVATALMSGTTTLMTPFKTTAFDSDTVRVPELGVSVAPATAQQYAALVSALRPYVVRGVTPMVTLDQKAGLAYLLGGVPVGSTWTDASTPTRTAGILALACRNGDPPGARRPVLVVDRAIDPSLARALDECGFDFPRAYRRLADPGGPPGLILLVPRGGSRAPPRSAGR